MEPQHMDIPCDFIFQLEYGYQGDQVNSYGTLEATSDGNGSGQTQEAWESRLTL